MTINRKVDQYFGALQSHVHNCIYEHRLLYKSTLAILYLWDRPYQSCQMLVLLTDISAFNSGRKDIPSLFQNPRIAIGEKTAGCG